MVKFNILRYFHVLKLNISIFILLSEPFLQPTCGQNRSFSIDYEQNSFLLDGKPFRFISGEAHYFRMPRAYWRDRLKKLRAAGLNAVSTYVEWSQHERIPGKYNFTGDLNITDFIKTAMEEDLLVILRPGPYVSAERDMGGLPYWLLGYHSDISLRTSDSNYLECVEKWLNVFFEKVKHLWYGNGGPVILVQVENEYGSYPACDREYLVWLKNLFEKHVGDKAVLFTTDGKYVTMLKCGKIPGVYATVDFGPKKNVTKAFAAQRKYEPKGPLVNSEFYPGWLTHWGEKMANVSTSKIVKTLREILDVGGNVNFYMFHGGSNFGFTAGANFGTNKYQADIQSYDYDAPISEAGDLTEKYYEIQKVLGEYVTLPNITVETAGKGDYGEITLQATASLFAPSIRNTQGRSTKRYYPANFETLKQNFGYLLYETSLPESVEQHLNIEKFHDLAHIYVNENPVGNLSRELKTHSLKLPNTAQNDKLSIIVENLGRINYGIHMKDFKGILSNVTLGDKLLTPWNLTSFEFENVTGVEKCFAELVKNKIKNAECYNGTGFIFYAAKFQINKERKDAGAPLDTYLDVSNLNKGFVFINGVNIGRYWPARGPQYSVYIPGVYLKNYPDENLIVVMDEEIKLDEIKLNFKTAPIFIKKLSEA